MPSRTSPTDAIQTYLRRIQENLASGISSEDTHRSALEHLLESLDPTVRAFNDPKHISVGAPDFTVRRKGNATDFPVGWLETKDIGEDLNKAEKSEQLERYFGLPNLILTDYLEFRWFVDGKLRLKAQLATPGRGARLRRVPEGEQQVSAILTEFLSYSLATLATPQELAERMAKLAHLIRDVLLRTLQAEPTSGHLHNQFEAFRETLIPDLNPDQFADMYAQTIAYGLFAARCQSTASAREFSRAAAADLIPRTNPFLRRLFREIAFELDPRVQPFVDDLVALLRHAEIGKIMEDFGKRTAKEDPVVHFYEDFLQEYDPKIREMRGVYYTPEPVVSYIVRSIDHLLRTEFGKPLGLADKDVLILDPACGTGTFLYYVIRHIHTTLQERGQKGQWNRYVSENLLKRVFGFELLMAPYAVAHLKLGLLLQDLGYKFESDERLGVYLTNTLEEAIKKSEKVFAEWISEEANAASEIKREKPIMVVLGNPPYSGHSANRSYFERAVGPGDSYSVVVGGPLPEQQSVITRIAKKRMKVRERTFIGRLMQDYHFVDAQPLGERNPKWLQDDYVKFIRFGQWRIERTGYGILAFITNHGYLDNTTFRGMRQQLMDTFSGVTVLDLHGNSKKQEKAPDGAKDKNVFDIQQGVALGILVKQPNTSGATKMRHADLWGSREDKYKYLFEADISTTQWKTIEPESPQYLFVPQDSRLRLEYEVWWSLTEAMPISVLGFQTHRDPVAIGFNEDELRRQVSDYLGAEPPQNNWEEYQRLCSYRPFDSRRVYLDKRVADRPRLDVMRNMFEQNLALNLVRQTKANQWRHALVSQDPTPAVFLEIKDGSTIFPLYEYPKSNREQRGEQTTLEIPFLPWPAGKKGRRPNFNLTFIRELENGIGLKFVSDGRGDLRESFGPEDVFNYIYAVMYSPTFRERYKEFLTSDFPRVPLTSDKELFSALARVGSELVAIHTTKSPKLSQFITRYEQPGDHLVEKVLYVEPNPKVGIESGRVYIDAVQFFEGVTKEIWEFHIGGYQVCEKWLKDRKGRTLSSDEIDHYQKIVVALSETIRIMREIDEIIPGWPLP
jgi:hypothetical protein